MSITLLSYKVYKMIETNLREFGMKKNQIKVVKFLLANLDRRFNAKEIASGVNISLSRIYPILNKLSGYGLIQKHIGSQIEYSTDNPKERFSRFFGIRRAKINQVEKQFYDSIIDLKSKQQYFLSETREETYRQIYNAVKNAEWIKTLSKRITFFSKSDAAEFWDIELNKLLTQKLKETKINCEYLFDKSMINSKETKITATTKRKLAEALKNENFDFRTIESAFSPSLLITDKEAIVGFRTKSENRTTKALVSTTPEMRDFLIEIFDEIFSQAKKVEKVENI